MKKSIEKELRRTYVDYLVRHIPIKDDDRCRTEIMFEKMTQRVLSVVSQHIRLKVGDECLICDKGKLELVGANEPYTNDHLQCSNCDSTFNIRD
jgi:hypothetical protein